MSPPFSVNNFRNGRMRYVKHSGNSRYGMFFRIPHVSNFNNLNLSKLRIPLVRTFVVKVTVSGAVKHIVGLGASFKMEWIAARSIVLALMKHAHAFRHIRASGNYPRHPMGKHSPEPATPSSERCGAVSVGVSIPIPIPALSKISRSNVRPKSYNEGVGEKLINYFLGYSLYSHSVMSLIVCRALGYASNARAFTFLHP